MLRPLYRFVLCLHPARFRARFAGEMLSIFDQAAGRTAALRLLLDALLSLARQWTLRPEFWRESSPPPQPVSDGVPSFFTLDPFRPRAAAIAQGLIVTMAVFCLTCFAIRYSWIHLLHVRIPEVQFENPSLPTSAKGGAAATLVPDDRRPSLPPNDKAGFASSRTPGDVPIAPQLPLVKKLGAPPSAAASQSETGSMPSTGSPAPTGFWIPVQPYLGTFVVDSPDRLTISITAENDQLMMEVAGHPKHALVAVSETTFVVIGEENTRIVFVVDPDGVHELQLSQGRIQFIAHRQ